MNRKSIKTDCGINYKPFTDAYHHPQDNFSDLNEKTEANETDLLFLRGLLDSPAVTQRIKVSFFLTHILY